jgi:hypothetical protein
MERKTLVGLLIALCLLIVFGIIGMAISKHKES